MNRTASTSAGVHTCYYAHASIPLSYIMHGININQFSYRVWEVYDKNRMCTSSEVLPTVEDALPEIPIDEYTASALGLTETVEKYLIGGGCVNKSNIQGWSMLQYASFIGHTNIVHLLLEKGADPNKGTCPPLMLAARCGNDPILIALLNKGASLEQVDNSGLTGLQHAVGSGQDSSVTVLLRHSKRISPSESNVLLHSAVSYANVAVLK